MSPQVVSLPPEPRQPPSAHTTQTVALIPPGFLFLFRHGDAYDTHPSSASVGHRYLLPRIPFEDRGYCPLFSFGRILRTILLSPLQSSSQRTVAKTGKRDGWRKHIALSSQEDKPPTVFAREMLFVPQSSPLLVYVLMTSDGYSHVQRSIAAATFTGSNRTENRANKRTVIC